MTPLLNTALEPAEAIVALGHALERASYAFVTPTPATHARTLQRRHGRAVDLRDVFGWNLPFTADVLPLEIRTLLEQSGCWRPDGPWMRSTIRFSSLGDRLFAHSGFPTVAHDSVFFGPDTYRFVAALLRHAPMSKRLVDIGCGSGVGGIVLAERTRELVLADLNDSALAFTRINATLAGLAPTIVRSDVLAAIEEPVDLVIANPPYMADPTGPQYRDGGGELGEALAVRIVDESIVRLAPGGSLILYTGSAIVGGCDTFLRAVTPLLDREDVSFTYEELDPDVFGEQLEQPCYAAVERIAAVLLRVRVDG